MTRAFWIIVVATVVLSSFAGAAEWPQFRDRIRRELVTANRPLNLVRAKTFFGKLLWDPDCRRPLFRKDAFSLPNSIGRRTEDHLYAFGR